MFAGILVTVCIVTADGGEECREFSQNTTATIQECEQVIDAYEVYVVSQLIASGFPYILSGVDAQCVAIGEPA